jgi:hypothetical protein
MPKLYLRCRDKRQGDEWLLKLSETGGQLVDANGTPQATISHVEAENRFVFPSFWQSIKDLGIVVDTGNTVWFAPETDHLDQIRDFLGGALARQGPEAIGALQRKAWFQVIAGAILALIAIVGTLGSLIVALTNSAGGTYVIAIGILALGGTLLARGLAALSRAQRALAEREQEDL